MHRRDFRLKAEATRYVRLDRGRDPFDRERLDDVADLDVVVLVEADAALEAGLTSRQSSLKRRSEPILPS